MDRILVTILACFSTVYKYPVILIKTNFELNWTSHAINTEADQLLASLLVYFGILAVFITIIISLIALVRDKRADAILTAEIFSLKVTKSIIYRLRIRSILQLCVNLSVISSILLLLLCFIKLFRLAIDTYVIVLIFAFLTLFALFFFLIIVLYIFIVLFEISKTNKFSKEYYDDIEV